MKKEKGNEAASVCLEETEWPRFPNKGEGKLCMFVLLARKLLGGRLVGSSFTCNTTNVHHGQWKSLSVTLTLEQAPNQL